MAKRRGFGRKKTTPFWVWLVIAMVAAAMVVLICAKASCQQPQLYVPAGPPALQTQPLVPQAAGYVWTTAAYPTRNYLRGIVGAPPVYGWRWQTIYAPTP